MKARNLATVRIVDEGETVTFERNGKTVEKPSIGIEYNGRQKEDPFKWTLNNKSKNRLIDIFGRETRNWVGRIVEITIEGSAEYLHIAVDVIRTRRAAESEATAQSTIPQVVAQTAQAPPPAPAQAPPPAPAQAPPPAPAPTA